MQGHLRRTGAREIFDLMAEEISAHPVGKLASFMVFDEGRPRLDGMARGRGWDLDREQKAFERESRAELRRLYLKNLARRLAECGEYREKRREYMLRYHAQAKTKPGALAKAQAQRRRYRAAHNEQYRAERRRWRSRHLEKVRSAQRRSWAKNKDARNARRRVARARKSGKAERLAVKADTHARRAKRLASWRAYHARQRAKRGPQKAKAQCHTCGEAGHYAKTCGRSRGDRSAAGSP